MSRRMSAPILSVELDKGERAKPPGIILSGFVLRDGTGINFANEMLTGSKKVKENRAG